MKAEHGSFPKPYLECIESLNKAAKETQIRYILIGATARDLIMEYVYGIQSPRMTYDIDISIYVDSWESFEEFKSQLGNKGFTAHPRIAQKLNFTASTQEKVELDLVPFGGVSDASGDISWPPNGDFKMSVLGFSEALESITIATIANTEIPVISLEALCLLKLIAWLDRPRNRRQKDAKDIDFILSNYIKIENNQHAIYDDGFAEEYDFDLDMAIAAKLGHEVKKLCSETTTEYLINKLFSEQQEITLEELAREMSSLADTNLKLLTAFKNNFSAEQTI